MYNKKQLKIIAITLLIIILLLMGSATYLIAFHKTPKNTDINFSDKCKEQGGEPLNLVKDFSKQPLEFEEICVIKE